MDPLGRHAAQDRQPAADVVAIWIKLLGLIAVHQHVVKGVCICAKTAEICQSSSRCEAVSPTKLHRCEFPKAMLTATYEQCTHDTPAMLFMATAERHGTMHQAHDDSDSLVIHSSCLLRSTGASTQVEAFPDLPGSRTQTASRGRRTPGRRPAGRPSSA